MLRGSRTYQKGPKHQDKREEEREGGRNKQKQNDDMRRFFGFTNGHEPGAALRRTASDKKHAPKRNAGHPYATMQDCIIRRQARYQKRGRTPVPCSRQQMQISAKTVGREMVPLTLSPVKTDTAKSVNLCTTLRVGQKWHGTKHCHPSESSRKEKRKADKVDSVTLGSLSQAKRSKLGLQHRPQKLYIKKKPRT